MAAAKRIILWLWLVLLGVAHAPAAVLHAPENRVWKKIGVPTETRLVEASQVVGSHQANAPPAGETVLGCCLAAKEAQFLYRGVPAGTERYQQALQGIVKPRGTALDPISLRMHVLGEDVAAGVTSWTTNPAVAARFAGSEGKILKIPYNNVLDRIVPRPFVGGKHAAESEILLKGTLNGL